MIDLHTHTLYSDGGLLPAELVQRCEAKGLTAVALTDHADMSNLDFIVPRLVAAAEGLNPHHRIKTLAGIELTHLPPALIAPLTRQAYDLGAQLVVVHGESPVEPVAPGTNRAAIEAGVDILAHPGQITQAEVELAAEKGVMLEISARGGHSLGNGHLARLALAAGALLCINSDAHAPRDLMDPAFAESVGLNAGLTPSQVAECFANSQRLVDKAGAIEV